MKHWLFPDIIIIATAKKQQQMVLKLGLNTGFISSHSRRLMN